MPVLFDRKGKREGQLSGRSQFMKSVNITSNDESLMCRIVDVKIIDGHPNSLNGVDV
jgi:tRNA-2-methylthio-N6-dimethylallyladenosine synthase